MVRRIPALIFAAVLLTYGSAEADAQESGDGGVSKYSQLVNELFAPITDDLDLTQEQRAQIEAVAVAELARAEALLRRLDRVTGELDAEQLRETFDEDRVRALSAQVGQVFAELTVGKLRVKARVFALLTPEQKALVEQQLRLNKERGKGRLLF